MPYAVYKLLHVFGIAMLLVAVGGVATHAAAGGSKASNPVHMLILTLHGVGTILILVAGFGMLAKLSAEVTGFPAWLWPKLLIWLTLAALVVLPYRKPSLAVPIVVATPILVFAAAFFALFKPF